MTVDEAASLAMLEQAAVHLVPNAVLQVLSARFVQARNKLQALNQHKASAMLAHYRYVSHGWPLLPPKIQQGVLQTVQMALAENEQVEVSYTSAYHLEPDALKNPSLFSRPHQLNPLGLISRGPTTYLLATSGHFDDPRLYAMHRIQKAQRNYCRVRIPKDFDLDEWLVSHMQFSSGGNIILNAIITPNLAKILMETPLSLDQKIDVENGKLSAKVLDSMQIIWWILSQGSDIEVLKPVFLRKRISQYVRQTHELYARSFEGGL